jgi:ABC-type lipoprotein export system ATPase subunit
MMPAAAETPLLELRGVGKVYGRGETAVRVLEGIELSVARGEYLALMGRSGSGKSTLMNVLGLLDVPSEGAYLFEGKDVSRLTDDERSRLRGQVIGFVFQRFFLLPNMTVLENAELPMRYQDVAPAERQARARALLERVGLGHRLTHRPNQLSGGEQQRVAIARALVNRPRMVLADEPTGNLDTASHGRVMGLFAELRQETGVTLVVVTHDPSVGASAERCVEVKDGRVVPRGTLRFDAQAPVVRP